MTLFDIKNIDIYFTQNVINANANRTNTGNQEIVKRSFLNPDQIKAGLKFNYPKLQNGLNNVQKITVASYINFDPNLIKTKALFSYGFDSIILDIRPDLKLADLDQAYPISSNLLKQFKCGVDYFKIIKKNKLDLLDYDSQLRLDIYMSYLPKNKYYTWLFLRMFPMFNILLVNSDIKNADILTLSIFCPEEFFSLQGLLPLGFQVPVMDYYTKMYWYLYINDTEEQSFSEKLYSLLRNRYQATTVPNEFIKIVSLVRGLKKLKAESDLIHLLSYADSYIYNDIKEKKKLIQNSDSFNYLFSLFNSD